MKPRDIFGRPIDATFTVQEEGDGLVLYFESRGPGRNTEYAAGLELLFARLATIKAVILDAAVASSETEHLPSEERRINADGYPYPINLSGLSDLKRFRISLTSAQGRVGRASDASRGSGNPTKRIRLTLSFPVGSPGTVDDVAAILEGLLSHVRSYWTFCADPEVYRIEAAVEDLVVDHWATKGKPINAGDMVIVWNAQGTQRHRGIVALAEVVGEPSVTADSDNPYWTDWSSAAVPEKRVAVRYFKPSRVPLWLSDDDQGLLNTLSVGRGHGAIFSVTQEQWAAVVRALGGWHPPSSDTELAITQATSAQLIRQGRLTDPEARRAIDKYAMQRAIAHFSSGWTVQDVSRIACFDLLCRGEGGELRVEVKGTTTQGEAVLITRRELENAKRHFPNVALFVTSGISIDRTQKPPRASGGTDRILHPWDVAACRVAPVTLECWLPSGP